MPKQMTVAYRLVNFESEVNTIRLTNDIQIKEVIGKPAELLIYDRKIPVEGSDEWCAYLTGPPVHLRGVRITPFT